MRILKKKDVAEGDIDSSVSSESTMTHQEAHRDVVYTPANPLIQVFVVFRTQLLLYSKRWAALVLMVFISLLVPVLAVTGIFSLSGTPSSCMGTLLAALPFVILIGMLLFCGNALSTELFDGVGRLNLTQPVPRWVFYCGKFAASVVASISFVVLAYCSAWAVVASMFDVVDLSAVGTSFLLCILSVFACNAVAFGLGTVVKRAGGISFALLFMIIPLIPMMILMNGGDTISTIDAMMWLMPVPMDAAVGVFNGLSLTMSSMVINIYGVLNQYQPFLDPETVGHCMYACLIWGLSFFTLGLAIMFRREVK